MHELVAKQCMTSREKKHYGVYTAYDRGKEQLGVVTVGRIGVVVSDTATAWQRQLGLFGVIRVKD